VSIHGIHSSCRRSSFVRLRSRLNKEEKRKSAHGELVNFCRMGCAHHHGLGLVPKLRLGTLAGKLCFTKSAGLSNASRRKRSHRASVLSVPICRKRSFQRGVPKRSLGTSCKKNGARSVPATRRGVAFPCRQIADDDISKNIYR
jgi:hypothetical protein